jgi:ATP-dependent helicase/nuclease subunit A
MFDCPARMKTLIGLASALAAADHFALGEAAQSLRAHAMQAGRMVHELLQHLADAAPDAREKAAQIYVTRRGARLPTEVQESIAQQALTVLGDARLTALFGPGSRAEVSLAGSIEVNGRAREIVGQIDRLAETDTQVLIADFKTGTPPSGAMPASYAAQLALYRAAIQQLYPDREVQAFLIWTEGPRIEALTQEVAQAAFATLR